MANEDGRRATEVLIAVAGSVAAIPVVLGFIALGGVIFAGRVVVDAAGQVITLGLRNGARQPGRPSA